MSLCKGRRCRRPIIALLWLGAACAASADEAVLSLAEAQRLALLHQPLLQAGAAQADAARERAVAARQLPDPQLKLGVLNLPANTQDAWRFNRDSQTATSVGLMQEFPLAGKRELRSRSEALLATQADAMLAATGRAVRRDAALAFFDALDPHHAAELVQAQIEQARRAAEAAQIAYRSGARPQADVLAARAALGMLEDKRAELLQGYAAAREDLRRWIGDGADAVPEEPDEIAVPPLAQLLAALPQHPELLAADRGVARAEVAQRLARKSRQPDFNVELDYGYRQDYSEMVSLQVGVGLPIFTANRQDRDIAAAMSELDQQQAEREDLQRRLQAQVAGAYRQWEAYGQRYDRYRAEVLPPLGARVDATLADYRSGAGTFGAVLEARQALLDAQLALLELRLGRMRQAVRLNYFVAGD